MQSSNPTISAKSQNPPRYQPHSEEPPAYTAQHISRQPATHQSRDSARERHDGDVQCLRPDVRGAALYGQYPSLDGRWMSNPSDFGSNENDARRDASALSFDERGPNYRHAGSPTQFGPRRGPYGSWCSGSIDAYYNGGDRPEVYFYCARHDWQYPAGTCCAHCEQRLGNSGEAAPLTDLDFLA